MAVTQHGVGFTMRRRRDAFLSKSFAAQDLPNRHFWPRDYRTILINLMQAFLLISMYSSA